MKKKLIVLILSMLAMSAALWGQSITVTSPKAADEWCTGSTYTVTWAPSGAMQASVAIRLRVAGSSEKAPAAFTIANGEPNDGSFSWTVPNSVSPGSYFIRVRTDDSTVIGDSAVFKISNCPAQIIPPAPLPDDNPLPSARVTRNFHPTVNPNSLLPVLRVKLPVNGTQLMPGNNCFIAWSLPGGYPMVKIALIPLSQAQLGITAQGSEIKSSTENDGAFDWQVSSLERTGKFVVRILTPDDKIYGDSGVVTISSKSLPPEQRAHVVARDINTVLAQSAGISINKIDFSTIQPGKIQGIGVYVSVNSTSDFVLSPDFGHPQFGSVYLRCMIENPLTDNKGKFSPYNLMDAWASLKGGGGSLKLNALPAEIAKGPSKFTVDFHPVYAGEARGQEVVMKMPGDLFSGPKLCRQQFFPKLTITLHLVTKSGEAVASKMIYVIYDTKAWPLSSVILPGEVNSCQDGVQDW